MTASLRPPRDTAARLSRAGQSSHSVRSRAHGASDASCDCGETWECPRARCMTPTARPGARRKDRVPGAASFGSLPTCRARVPRRARPGGLAGPSRGGPQSGPACPASVRPPGHARPRTSQDTGQTTARRSRRRQPQPPAQMHAGKGKGRPPPEKKRQEKHSGNSPGIADREQIISYNLREGEGRDKSPASGIATGKRAKGNRRAPG